MSAVDLEALREALKRTDAIAVPFESDVALFVAAVRRLLDSPQVRVEQDEYEGGFTFFDGNGFVVMPDEDVFYVLLALDGEEPK